MNKLIKLNDLIKITGLSRSSIYLKISQGFIPKPIKIGEKSSRWLESDIDEWIESLRK